MSGGVNMWASSLTELQLHAKFQFGRFVVSEKSRGKKIASQFSRQPSTQSPHQLNLMRREPHLR